MWLLLAYLLWQALAVITGVSLWNWRRGGAS
jgi:tryptophan-rich sensory protein